MPQGQIQFYYKGMDIITGGRGSLRIRVSQVPPIQGSQVPPIRGRRVSPTRDNLVPPTRGLLDPPSSIKVFRRWMNYIILLPLSSMVELPTVTI